MLSFSAALPVRVSSSPCAPAREREGQRGRTSKKTSGKKEEKTTRRTSEQAKTKPFLCVIKGVTYLSGLLKNTRRGTKRKTAEREGQERTRNKRAKAQKVIESTHERQAQSGINERGGERRQGKVTLTHAQRESEEDLGEAGRRQRSTQRQNESFLDCHAPPLPPTALLPHHPVKKQTRVRERERERAHMHSS